MTRKVDGCSSGPVPEGAASELIVQLVGVGEAGLATNPGVFVACIQRVQDRVFLCSKHAAMPGVASALGDDVHNRARIENVRVWRLRLGARQPQRHVHQFLPSAHPGWIGHPGWLLPDGHIEPGSAGRCRIQRFRKHQRKSAVRQRADQLDRPDRSDFCVDRARLPRRDLRPSQP